MKQALPSINKPFLSSFIRSVWFFPALICLLVLILTALQLSGTSVGQYHGLLFGDDARDNALITGEPRKIRSDEWGVNTPLSLSQAKEGFPTVNPNTGNGQDMTLTFDVPYKDWSIIFRPQNWSFFVMPFEHAFAFKWWFVAATLILACYSFTLTLLPKRYLLASLLSLCIAASPFLHWWYQSGVFLSIAYALLICSVVLRMIQNPPLSQNKRILLAAMLAYLLTAFGFILYAPFLIPITLAIGAFLIGHLLVWLKKPEKQPDKLRTLALLAAPALIAGIFTLLFISAHSQVIHALGSSVYPGQRTEPSGGYSLLQFLGGYYNFNLQDDATAAHYDHNQSEASNFILVFPFLLPLFAYLFIKRRTLKQPIDWTTILLLIVALLLFGRLFIPPLEILFNILQINRIPHNRLLIGFGVLNLLLISLSIHRLQRFTASLPTTLVYGSTAYAWLTVFAVGLGLRASHPGYASNMFTILLASTIIAAITYLILTRRPLFAVGLLAAFSLFSVYNVNPLYQGLGILTQSRLSNSIRMLDDHNSRWIIGDYAATFESLPAANGVRSLSGVYAYPQNDIWNDIGADPQTKAVYNRYAHVFFTVGPLRQEPQSQGAYFDPPALDAFRVHADGCSQFLADHKVRYVLLTTKQTSNCLYPIREISYPKLTFYIHEIRR